MLFDLSGKRKNVVRVVYGFLAVIFAGGFLFFGIGSEGGGGLGDLLGFGTNDTGSGNPQFDQQIEDAEAAIATDPADEQALADLISVRFQAGNAALEGDETTGQISITPEAETQYQEAISAWEDYLKVAKKPDSGTAAIANNVYGSLISFSEPQDLPLLAKDAVLPAQLSADDNPGVGTYATLAQYAYFSGDSEVGDEAAKKAVAEADPSQQKSLEKQLASTAKAAEQLQKEIEKQAKKGSGEEAFTNPLEGGLGGGALPGAPAVPGAPAAPAPAP
ncbi:MAG: hypothetical protein ACR2OC_05015 [Solirubrobacterales bacterium]